MRCTPGRRLLIALVAAAVLAGCGNEPTPPPDVATPAPPAGTKAVVYDKSGVRFTAPANWPTLTPVGSRVGGVTSGSAVVAVWRYERSEPLPTDRRQVVAASERLIEQVIERDASAKVKRVDVGRNRIELRGTQTINEVPVGVRSLHVFDRGAEIVIDAYAPVEVFDEVDAKVFGPLMKSVRVSKPK